MIDTLKLGYPLDEELYSKVVVLKSTLRKLSPDGYVMWEKGFIDNLPSHFSGLRIHENGAKAYFEFSLQKWGNDLNYNHENTNLLYDMTALDRWIKILSSYLGYAFNQQRFEVFRVDLAINYILEGTNIQYFFRALELNLGRSENNYRKFGTCYYYGSTWIAKKIYQKSSEYKKNERPKRRKHQLPELIINENLIRLEIEMKRQFLRANNLVRISDIPQLRARFWEEKRKIESVENFKTNKLDLSPRELHICSLVIEYGFILGRKEHIDRTSESSWFRLKRSLKKKGIYLEALKRADLREKEADKYIHLKIA